MIIENRQDTIKIEHGDDIKNIGIKLSGGADSAMVTYLLCKYITDEQHYEKTLVPFTTIHGNKPTNLWYALKVKWWMQENFPKVKWYEEHFTNHANGTNYGDKVNELSDELFEKKIIDFKYSGVTANPPREVHVKFKGVGDPTSGIPPGGGLNGGLPFDRDKVEGQKIDTSSGKIFANIDKQGIAELYQQYDLIDTLFPLTRTCEAKWNNTEKIPHCGECVWCEERLWGFGKL